MYKLVSLSRNSKTGIMPAVYGSRESCPTTCALYSACYGKSGHASLHWADNSSADHNALVTWIRALPRDGMWRYGVVGDLPHDRGVIDASALGDIASANNGRPVLAYTHHLPTGDNIRALANVRHTMHVNVSCDSVQDIKSVLNAGLSAVTYTSSGDTRKTWTDAGIKYVTCPNQSTKKAPTCAQCRLCARPRDYVIVFRAHGNSKNTIQGVI